MWYSIAGMLCASVGASMLPVAKYAWERWEHLLAPKQERERAAQVACGFHVHACTGLHARTSPCCFVPLSLLLVMGASASQAVSSCARHWQRVR